MTIRLPRPALALVVALLLHAGLMVGAAQLPTPRKAPARIELSIAPPRPPPPPRAAAPSLVAPAEATPAVQKARRPRVTSASPVVPELPPGQPPSETRAQLPMVERSADPAPPPEPMAWGDRLREQLRAQLPGSTAFMNQALLPSRAVLDRVAAADPRLHDEDTERRLQRDHGAFFRRGLEALRGNWRPGEVLELTERDPARRCGHSTRTTLAVAIIDRAGKVIDVELRAPSGCANLDDEAVAAFKRVAAFPNPPEGIFVSPEGGPTETARYPVRFIVTFDGGLKLDWRG